MKVEMGRRYRTRQGEAVTLLSTSVPGPLPVVGYRLRGEEAVVMTFTQEGRCYANREALSSNDLVEATPWDELEIDAPVWAWLSGDEGSPEKWVRKHFAGVVEGRPTTWVSGATSRTVDRIGAGPFVAVWEGVRLATPSECAQPWDGWRIGELVEVSNEPTGPWERRYFAGLSDRPGHPICVWSSGRSPWSGYAVFEHWKWVRKAESSAPEEK